MQFISYRKNPHVTVFNDFFDIEYSNDVHRVLQSKKAFIGWNYFTNQRFFDHCSASGRAAYCVERGALPGTVFIDGGGFNVTSGSYSPSQWQRDLNAVELARVNAYISDFVDDSGSLEPQKSNRQPIEALRQQLASGNFERIVFVPLQLNRDTV